MIYIGITIGIGPSGALLHAIGIGTIIGIGIGVGQWKCTMRPIQIPIKCAQNPMEIYSGLLNTTQFCTSHLLSVTVFVSVSNSVNTHHKKAALTMLSVQVDKNSELWGKASRLTVHICAITASTRSQCSAMFASVKRLQLYSKRSGAE